jgi:hypothetical protein
MLASFIRYVPGRDSVIPRPKPARVDGVDPTLILLDSDAAAPQLLGRTYEILCLGGGDPGELGRGRGGIRMAGMARDSHEAYAGNARDLESELDAGFAGRPAEPAVAGVDLEQDVDRLRAGGVAQQHRGLHRVDRHPDLGALAQGEQAGDLLGGQQWIGERHARAPRVDHGLHLEQRRAGRADRPAVELEPHELRDLVRLDVGPQPYAVCAGGGEHLLDVPFDLVQVDHRGGRLDLCQRLGSQHGAIFTLRAGRVRTRLGRGA